MLGVRRNDGKRAGFDDFGFLSAQREVFRLDTPYMGR